MAGFAPGFVKKPARKLRIPYMCRESRYPEGMTEITREQAATTYARLFAQAVARVIEDARWEARIKSVRELERRAGFSNGTLAQRFKEGVPFNVRDLAQVAAVLDVSPGELVLRAERIVGLPPGIGSESGMDDRTG